MSQSIEANAAAAEDTDGRIGAVQASGDAPGRGDRARGHRARRWLGAALTIVSVAAVLQIAYDPWYLNYDARYALLWARDLLEGGTPEYLADFAPTPHPLQMAFGLIAVPFGEAGPR